jgi:hypothetical protein
MKIRKFRKVPGTLCKAGHEFLNKQHARIKATYRGDVIGWFDTLAEAEAAIDAAREEEKREENVA